MQRVNTAPTFTDLAVADLGGPAATAFFARLSAAVPFERLAASVADIFKDDAIAAAAKGGAPHWPVVTMIRVMFLQKCFGLSDPMAEEMLRDRISFRRFAGLSFDDRTPDHSVLSEVEGSACSASGCGTPGTGRPCSTRRWPSCGSAGWS